MGSDMEPLPVLAGVEKKISAFPGWSNPDEGTGFIWFDAPLEIGGVTERGFVLHGGSYYDKPDCHVVLELRISRTPGRSCRPLVRVEWRSLTGGHTNPRRKGAAWSGQRVGATHCHPFELNWNSEAKRMLFRKLRVACDIADDLKTFNDLRNFAGKVFRISNMDIVKEPPWEYILGV